MTAAAAHGDWATMFPELVREVKLKLAQSLDSGRVQAVRCVGDATMEIVYRQPFEETLRGLRLTAADIESDPWLDSHNAEEIAAFVVLVGLGEPKADDDFGPADADGVTWIASLDWILP